MSEVLDIQIDEAAKLALVARSIFKRLNVRELEALERRVLGPTVIHPGVRNHSQVLEHVLELVGYLLMMEIDRVTEAHKKTQLAGTVSAAEGSPDGA